MVSEQTGADYSAELENIARKHVLEYALANGKRARIIIDREKIKGDDGWI